MIQTVINKIFGTKSERDLKKIQHYVDKANSLESQMEALSDDELKAKTQEFKNRLAQGETLDDILAEAFATVREAAKRVIGLRPYDVQLLGGIVLHQGKIAEMLNICDRLEHYPYELSGGEKQRAAVGRALINSPSIIFADEPTGNLDADTSKAVMDMLIGLQHEFKIAMIIVTHDKDIADYCCRTVHIQDGKMY